MNSKKGSDRRTPRERSSVRSRKDPIEVLEEEHEQALRYTTILRDAAERIQNIGFSSEVYMEISNAILFIETKFRLHDKKEEQILFPYLSRSLPDLVNALRYEHRELWSAMNQLRAIVKDVADGNIHGSSIIELVRATLTVADLLKNHIEKENTVIFPQVRKLLSAKEYRQFVQNFSETLQT